MSHRERNEFERVVAGEHIDAVHHFVAACPAGKLEPEAAQHARGDLADRAVAHDADAFVPRGVRRLVGVPTAFGLRGDHARKVAQDRQCGETAIFAEGLRGLLADHADDRQMRRHGRIAHDMIDAGGTAEDDAQVLVAGEAAGLGFPHQHITDRIRIDRRVVPATHLQIRRDGAKAGLPFRHGFVAAGLHQEKPSCVGHAALATLRMMHLTFPAV